VAVVTIIFIAVDFDSQKRFETKLQCLHRLQEGIAFGDGLQVSDLGFHENILG